MPDELLEKLWSDVINLDPKGRWIDDTIRTPASGRFREIAGFLSRLVAAGASREDLGRVGRFDRYEACFGTLYNLDDPGPGRRQLRTLASMAKKAATTDGDIDEFSEALREIFGSPEEYAATEDYDDWLQDRIKQCADRPDEPFADAGEALRRLKAAGATADELSKLSSWHRYEGCWRTLHAVAESGVESVDDIVGIHESLLGAEPTGKDGRPGSWP